jgi:hypothetical protein
VVEAVVLGKGTEEVAVATVYMLERSPTDSIVDVDHTRVGGDCG